MGINFPNAPTLNQLWPQPAVVGLPVYRWDGEKWTTQGSSSGALIYISDTPPANALDGSLWWESDVGLMYLRYFDGDSSQWVMAMPVADATRYAVRFDTPQTLTAAQQIQARNNIGASSQKRNYVINGAMQISQENGTTNGTISAYYPVDQFQYIGSHDGGIGTAQNSTPTPAGSPYRLRLAVSTADTAIAAAQYAMIRTSLEGLRMADLKFGLAAAKTFILQFGVKAPAGTYGISIRNGAAARSYVAEYVIAAGEANTDVIKSIVVPGDVAGTWVSDNTLWATIDWGLAMGSNYFGTPGSWLAGNFTGTANQFNLLGTVGNAFELFDVSLTEGTVAPAFVVPDYASELLSCQRYYHRRTSELAGSGQAGWTVGGWFIHPVQMRAAPTVAVGGGTATSLSGLVADSATIYGCRNLANIVAAGNGYWSGYTLTANARL